MNQKIDDAIIVERHRISAIILEKIYLPGSFK